jgi:hypothetical protein
MKIPGNVIYNSSIFDRMLSIWGNIAYQIGAEYGVYIEVKVKAENDDPQPQSDKSIVFVVAGNEFGSVQELKKGLDNGAFL